MTLSLKRSFVNMMSQYFRSAMDKIQFSQKINDFCKLFVLIWYDCETITLILPWKSDTIFEPYHCVYFERLIVYKQTSNDFEGINK